MFSKKQQNKQPPFYEQAKEELNKLTARLIEEKNTIPSENILAENEALIKQNPLLQNMPVINNSPKLTTRGNAIAQSRAKLESIKRLEEKISKLEGDISTVKINTESRARIPPIPPISFWKKLRHPINWFKFKLSFWAKSSGTMKPIHETEQAELRQKLNEVSEELEKIKKLGLTANTENETPITKKKLS